MQTYLVQLRGEDEDDGDDRLALAGRHYFLSSAPSSTFFFFCFLSVLDPFALSLLRVFSLLSLCFSLCSSVRRGTMMVRVLVLRVGWTQAFSGSVFLLPFSVAFSGFYKAREWPFFPCSCLTIVRHESLCFFEKKQGQKICSPLSCSFPCPFPVLLPVFFSSLSAQPLFFFFCVPFLSGFFRHSFLFPAVRGLFFPAPARIPSLAFIVGEWHASPLVMKTQDRYCRSSDGRGVRFSGLVSGRRRTILFETTPFDC